MNLFLTRLKLTAIVKMNVGPFMNFYMMSVKSLMMNKMRWIR